jgi:hypothetical protein
MRLVALLLPFMIVYSPLIESAETPGQLKEFCGSPTDTLIGSYRSGICAGYFYGVLPDVIQNMRAAGCEPDLKYTIEDAVEYFGAYMIRKDLKKMSTKEAVTASFFDLNGCRQKSVRSP